MIINGSPHALDAVLIGAIAYLFYEKQKVEKQLEESFTKVENSKDQYIQSIERIIEKYHQGNIELVQALNEIKIVLATMQKTL